MSRGHGLEPADVDLLFPESQEFEPESLSEADRRPQRPNPAAPVSERRPLDYKERASGERPELEDPDGWPIEDIGAPAPDPEPPDLSSEAWPDDLGPDDEPDSKPIEESPEPQNQPVREQPPQIAVQAPVHAGRRRLPPLPSDREWFPAMRKILDAGGK